MFQVWGGRRHLQLSRQERSVPSLLPFLMGVLVGRSLPPDGEVMSTLQAPLGVKLDPWKNPNRTSIPSRDIT